MLLTLSSSILVLYRIMFARLRDVILQHAEEKQAITNINVYNSTLRCNVLEDFQLKSLRMPFMRVHMLLVLLIHEGR